MGREQNPAYVLLSPPHKRCSEVPVDSSRAAELTGLIQRLHAEIPIEAELLVQVDQALTHVSTGRARNLERLEFLGDAVLRLGSAGRRLSHPEHHGGPARDHRERTG